MVPGPRVGKAHRLRAGAFPSSGTFGRLSGPSAHDGAMTDMPWEVAIRAADVLAPESSLSSPDVAQLGDALAKAVRTAAGNPMHLANVGLNLAVALAQVPPKTLTQWLSDGKTVPAGLDPKDRRFSDPTWNGNPFFVALRLIHAAALPRQ